MKEENKGRLKLDEFFDLEEIINQKKVENRRSLNNLEIEELLNNTKYIGFIYKNRLRKLAKSPISNIDDLIQAFPLGIKNASLEEIKFIKDSISSVRSKLSKKIYFMLDLEGLPSDALVSSIESTSMKLENFEKICGLSNEEYVASKIKKKESENMNEFKKVNVLEYVKEGLISGKMTPFEAEKFARIIAKQGEVGETVISWSEDKEGNEIKEKEDVVELDKETNQPGWIATKLDENGYPVKDKNGHLNQWIIDDTTFKKKYEIDQENPGLYKPTGALQIFVEIKDNIILEQCGSEMQIAAGGFINITNVNDMYGISARDFNDTYRKTGKEVSVKL